VVYVCQRRHEKTDDVAQRAFEMFSHWETVAHSVLPSFQTKLMLLFLG